jgi:hypothetical protein
MTYQEKVRLSNLLSECIKLDPLDSYFLEKFNKLNTIELDYGRPTVKELGRFWRKLSIEITKMFRSGVIDIPDEFTLRYDYKDLFITLLPKDLFAKKMTLLRIYEKKEQNELTDVTNEMVNIEILNHFIMNINLLIEKQI